ncbi:MAG: acetyl-CoA carboxylase biotin carboxyl carrier protein subunit [Candidatus Kapabacteria bacterium]|nr:acetyl-CoA carboxylase biotin carboxyl carrier protein subunit [Candidatus Kapabacteria bacterium]
MNQKLAISLNKKEFSVSFDKKDKSIIYVDEKPFKIDSIKNYGDNIHSFSVNQKLHNVEINFSDPEALTIFSEGMTHSIEICDEKQKMLNRFISQGKAAGLNGKVIMKAPMPGMVIKCFVSEGMSVEKGDKMVIIEAMKMENSINSPCAGTIKTLKIKEGNPVAKDSVLFEIDSSPVAM